MRSLLLLITLFSTLKAHDVSIVAIFRNEAHYLREWVEYHKMIGVDHFRLYNNASEDHFEQVLAPYVTSGLVEVIDWRGDAEPGKAYNFIPDQIKAYQHGLTALTHKSSWVALIDIDEFIVPMRDFSLKTCLNKHFQNADAIHVNWRNFGTSHVTISKGENILPHLKKCSHRRHKRNLVGKTIIRPESGDIQKMHYAHHLPLYPGKTFVDGHKNPIDFVDNDLRPPGKHLDHYIRINHYALRDEDYFWNVRKKRNNYGYGGDELLDPNYRAFGLCSDTRILKILEHYTH